ncbi:MAG: transaldolase [Opitutales bacterium]|nr:transaldolase [Opitutales bacterium]
MNTLEALQQYTRVVADTGQVDEIRQLHPEEATTNPSLLLKVFQSDSGRQLLDKVYEALKAKNNASPSVSAIAQMGLVWVATEILLCITGRVSIEVEARLSFDTQAMIQAAKRLVQSCKDLGIDTRRILIKIASTWEGIQAARELERLGIACNATLIFHEQQALACAQAGVTLISPFVGRIYDWYVARGLWKEGEVDPGVQSVQRIFTLLKSQGYKTEIMGASFRNIDEILALVGCDRLTIAPKFLKQLAESTEPAECQLKAPALAKEKLPPVTEAGFRWALNQDPMATEKLSDGIRLFAQDSVKLAQLIQAYLDQK